MAERSKALDSKSSRRLEGRLASSNLALSAIGRPCGEVAERSKALAWRASGRLIPPRGFKSLPLRHLRIEAVVVLDGEVAVP